MNNRPDYISALAYALARADLPRRDSMETSRDYAERLAPLLIESGYLPENEAAAGYGLVEPWRKALAALYDHEANRADHGLEDGCYEAARALLAEKGGTE